MRPHAYERRIHTIPIRNMLLPVHTCVPCALCVYRLISLYFACTGGGQYENTLFYYYYYYEDDDGSACQAAAAAAAAAFTLFSVCTKPARWLCRLNCHRYRAMRGDCVVYAHTLEYRKRTRVRVVRYTHVRIAARRMILSTHIASFSISI